MASDLSESTTLVLLDARTPVELTELAKHYGYPGGLDRCWVRGNMIASVDGAATFDGRSGGMAGAGDRALFAVQRELADVVLVGAGTVRTENYAGAQLSIAARQRRQAVGQAEVPPIAVVTGSGELYPSSRLCTLTETPPLIFTTATALAATQDRMHGHAVVLDASTDDPTLVDPKAVVAELARRGLYRVLCEGGPTLLGQLIAEGLLDELALTIAPILVGGTAPRVVDWRSSTSARLRPALTLTDDDGYLYLRYKLS